MSTLKVNAIQNTSGVEQYLAKAWVNFNGASPGGLVNTIRASGNVSSVSDNGLGDYTVNFATALVDANYAVSIMAGATTSVGVNNTNGSPRTTQTSASSVRILTRQQASDAAYDNDLVSVIVFR